MESISWFSSPLKKGERKVRFNKEASKWAFTYFVIGSAFLGLVSCIDAADQNQDMPNAADGAAFFAENCVACHGSDGRGTGVAADRLTVAPKDLTTLSKENGGKFPEAQALSYIYGDAQNSHLARVMPEFGDEMASDLVPVEIDGVLTPTPRELAGLLAYLESIQQ